MKKTTIIISALLAFVLIFAGCSKTGELGLVDNTLLVGVDDTYPPME